MVRRRLTLKRIDPWSVLKFGFVANLALLAIGMLGAAVVWFFIRQLGLIERVCGMAQQVGFEACGINGGNLFRLLLLLGLLGVVVQTGLFVFLSFLHNLIADLVGGLSFTYVDDTPGSVARGEVPSRAVRTAREPPPVPQEQRAPALVGGGSGSAWGGPPVEDPSPRATTSTPSSDGAAGDRTAAMPHVRPSSTTPPRREESLFGDDRT